MDPAKLLEIKLLHVKIDIWLKSAILKLKFKMGPKVKIWKVWGLEIGILKS